MDAEVLEDMGSEGRRRERGAASGVEGRRRIEGLRQGEEGGTAT